jgi:hypothetical protein
MGYRMFAESKDNEKKTTGGIKLPQVSQTFLPFDNTKEVFVYFCNDILKRHESIHFLSRIAMAYH